MIDQNQHIARRHAAIAVDVEGVRRVVPSSDDHRFRIEITRRLFLVPDAVSPLATGLSADSRLLGVQVGEIRFVAG